MLSRFFMSIFLNIFILSSKLYKTTTMSEAKVLFKLKLLFKQNIIFREFNLIFIFVK